MPRDDRKLILEALEKELKMPVLSYVTGDRQNLETQIAPDQIRRFPRHLKAIGEKDAIALLVYTRGGDINVPWPLVNFLRAYARQIVALVPFFAHSSGTLICLGCDTIVMSKLATLSPIDPSVANAFNPQDPANPQNRIQIAVEDVIAYFQLAKTHGVSRDDDVAAAFGRLAEAVHPLALGNVHRSIEQIKQLAEKLITLHSSAEPGEVEERIRRLTTAFYTHSHLINPKEAAALGLPVKAPSPELETLLLDYYEQLVTDLDLATKFDPSKFVAVAQALGAPALHRFERGYIETMRTADAYVTEGAISMQVQQLAIQMPPGMQTPALPAVATFEITKDEWEETA